MCTLMLRHWRAGGENNLWSSIQRAEGGCEAGRFWFTQLWFLGV